WAYGDDAVRVEAACHWLAEGLRLWQRAMYVGEGTVPELTAELAGLEGRDAALADGRLAVVSSADLYDLSAPIDPVAQLAVYDGAVAQAIADGYRGVRVVADITPLVADAGRRAAHVHWEQYADRYMTGRPLAPLCMYDTRRIERLDAVTAAHPLSGPEPRPFGLFATGPSTACCDGEIDATVSDVFDELLRTLPAGDTELDLRGLTFVDGRAAATLHGALVRRRDDGRALRVVGANALVRRVWGLCDFDAELLSPG
ncbi:MAG TPA: MEDS domain-containing protein, partial [Acidimicrobiales bacterium]|nr:MEDS domain-containing protein [Acidimicrobiales bacterium]